MNIWKKKKGGYMIKFDGDIREVEDKIFKRSILLTSLINSRKGRLNVDTILLISTWIELEGKTNDKGRLNLFVSLINGGLTDIGIKNFLEVIKKRYKNKLINHFK